MELIMHDLPQLLTREQAAKYLGTSKGTLENWASTKRYDLPFIKIGSAVRYKAEDLLAFLERNTIKPKTITELQRS